MCQSSRAARRYSIALPTKATIVAMISLLITSVSSTGTTTTTRRKKDPILPANNNDTIRVAWAGSSRADHRYPLIHLHFCLGCPVPAAEGSVVSALAPYHGLRDFTVTGDVAYAVPNDGRSDLLNAEDMRDRIAMVNRGEVPIVDKVLRVQAAGAHGIMVVDLEIGDGGCEEGFASCGRLGGARDGGFAKRDGAHTWAAVKIPAILLSAAQGDRLRRIMPRLEKMNVQGYGQQLVER